MMAHMYMNAVGILGYYMKESEFYQQSDNTDYKLGTESLNWVLKICCLSPLSQLKEAEAQNIFEHCHQERRVQEKGICSTEKK